MATKQSTQTKCNKTIIIYQIFDVTRLILPFLLVVFHVFQCPSLGFFWIYIELKVLHSEMERIAVAGRSCTVKRSLAGHVDMCG